MQNANIKYLILIEKGKYAGKEVGMNFALDELEGYDVISEKLFELKYYDSMGHPSEYWTVIERNIEVFND